MPPSTRLVWLQDATPRAPGGDGLSRERVLAAALALADREPHAAVTMRGVAQELGVRSPMALYRWVGGSKEGLTDLMVDAVYAEITVPTDDGWRAGLRGLGLSAWAAVGRHPWFARAAFSRPPLGPGALALYDRALGLLADADLDLELDAATRMGAVNTVLGHVLGSGLARLEESAMRASTGLATDAELGASVAPYLEHVAAAGTHPHFSRWAADPARLDDPPQSFERILEWLLDGLAALVTDPPGARRAARRAAR